MSLRAEITFTGLFLFAPVGNRLHVILPKSDQLGGGHIHEAKMFYEKMRVQEQDLPKHFFLDLTTIPGGVAVPPLPSSIVEAGSLIGNKKIKKEKALTKHHADVHGVITLSAPDDISPGPTTLWDIPTFKTLYLTNHLKCVWTDVPAGDLTLNVERKGTTPITIIIPPDTDGWELDFDHTPGTDPEIEKGEPAHHFEAYYPVFDSASRNPKPHLAEEPPLFVELTEEELSGRSLRERRLFAAASTFTCMLSQGKLTP